MSTGHYSMIFAFSPDLTDLLLLRKPDDHRNSIFRGRWSVPGGHQEAWENSLTCARREMAEETGLHPGDMLFILRMSCDCDDDEPEHFISVYGTSFSLRDLKRARGSIAEPVKVHSLLELPENMVWHLPPLIDLVRFRMDQGFQPPTVECAQADSTEKPTEAKS